MSKIDFNSAFLNGFGKEPAKKKSSNVKRVIEKSVKIVRQSGKANFKSDYASMTSDDLARLNNLKTNHVSAGKKV